MKDQQSQKNELELTPQQLEEMMEETIQAVSHFIANLPHAPAQNIENATEMAYQYKEDLPLNPTAFSKLLEELFQKAIPKSLNTTGPGYMAYIPGGGLLHAAVADFITNSVNRFVGIPQTAPVLTQLETNTIRWLAEIMGYPKSSKGTLTTGGSMANFMAVVTARTCKLPENFFQGTLYTSHQAHLSVVKAATVAGFPKANIRLIPSDKSTMQVDLKQLEKQINEDLQNNFQPFMIVGHAGTTNSGAVDPLQELSALCQKYHLWFHVDAAYGGAFHLTERGKKIMTGISQADSITLDPHKAFFLPYGTGTFLVREGKHLEQAFASSGSADYLPENSNDQSNQSNPENQENEIWNFNNLSPELSREWRGLRLWLPMKMHGIEAFQRALDEKLDLTQQLYQQISQLPGIEILHPPYLSLFAFRYHQKDQLKHLNQLNLKIIKAINSKNRVHLSGTYFDGQYYIRVCILSFRTHQHHVDMMLEDLKEALKTLTETISNHQSS